MASIPLVNLVLLYYIALTPWPRDGGWNGGTGPTSQGDAKF